MRFWLLGFVVAYALGGCGLSVIQSCHSWYDLWALRSMISRAVDRSWFKPIQIIPCNRSWPSRSVCLFDGKKMEFYNFFHEVDWHGGFGQELQYIHLGRWRYNGSFSVGLEKLSVIHTGHLHQVRGGLEVAQDL
ncbi:MAG: hypothetical protein ACON5A_05825 [Candidatus Comchoanobacterales bacterium]